jgi:hypothetical protein
MWVCDAGWHGGSTSVRPATVKLPEPERWLGRDDVHRDVIGCVFHTPNFQQYN